MSNEPFTNNRSLVDKDGRLDRPAAPPASIVGCLLDVSHSMQHILETGKGDRRAVERLRAVLRAALKLARVERRQNPSALMFIGAFGMKDKRTPVVDLCGLVDAFLGGADASELNCTGHELLIGLANRNNVGHVSDYIRAKLEDDQARLIYMYLQRHRDQIKQFIDAIPGPTKIKTIHTAPNQAGSRVGSFVGFASRAVMTKKMSDRVSTAASKATDRMVHRAVDHVVEDSKAIQLARRICDDWLQDFSDLIPRPIEDVVPLLERLEGHPSFGRDNSASVRNLLDELQPHLYGLTPMKGAMLAAKSVFDKNQDAEQRTLVVVSDGESTDGNPKRLASEMKKEGVIVATVFLTDDATIASRQFYDEPQDWFHVGPRALFTMASRVAVSTHPIPVLASMGWNVPSSGECALFTTVCSADTLEEFCSLLLSARFGSTDALLDIIGKVRLDLFVNDDLVKTCTNPSSQEASRACYAHACAAVLHVAMVRIVDREGGCPSISEIRNRILEDFPPGPGGRGMLEVLEKAISWYRPLRVRWVDEEEARQAVNLRRPVLATFRLSNSGWVKFAKYFMDESTRDQVLSRPEMEPHHSSAAEAGHAVVLVKCEPHALTFLNSWGNQWGSNGSFSIESPDVLEVDDAAELSRMRFFDVYWDEADLTAKERMAYYARVDETVKERAARHTGVADLEMQCPECKGVAPIADFTGSIRQARCPLCRRTFKPEPGHLVQALYARAGLGDAE